MFYKAALPDFDLKNKAKSDIMINTSAKNYQTRLMHVKVRAIGEGT